MSISTDSRFWIGKHKICEDYALSGIVDGQPYAIVSDGCSTSMANGAHSETHVGSLLLCHTAKKFIKTFFQDESTDHILDQARVACSMLDCDWTSLDATLGIITQVGTSIYCTIHGDGIFALINDDMAQIFVFEYDNGNAPYYLNYQDSKGFSKQFTSRRREGFKKQFGFKTQTTSITIDRNKGTTVGPCIVRHGEAPFKTEQYALNWNVALIMSDGPQSFVKREGYSDIKVPTAEVLEKLLDFKNLNGEFIQRGTNAFMKFCDKNGWRNLDDMSIAGFTIDKEEK